MLSSVDTSEEKDFITYGGLASVDPTEPELKHIMVEIQNHGLFKLVTNIIQLVVPPKAPQTMFSQHKSVA